MNKFDEACVRLAEKQHGAFSRFQIMERGATVSAINWRLGKGRWDLALPSVYRITGTPRSWQAHLMEACLWAGPEAAISHRSAAFLWRLPGFSPREVELSSPYPAHGIASIRAHEVTNLTEFDIAGREGIPVTTLERTLIDIGSVVPEETVARALDDCLRRRATTLEVLGWTLDRLGGHGRRGAGVLRDLLQARSRDDRVVESELEARLWNLLRRAGLPLPRKQHELRDGERTVRLDFAYPEQKLALETDGYRYHSLRPDWERDLTRRNWLTQRGWKVLHFTWETLRRSPAKVVADVRAGLAATR